MRDAATPATRTGSSATLLLLACAAFASGDAAEPTPPAKPAAATSAPAQPGPVSVAMTADPTVINVGEPVTVTITYRWPHGWSPATPNHEPDPSAAFAGEFVTSLPPGRRISTGEEERRVFAITCTAFRSGAWALPRPTLVVDGPRGRSEATADAIILQVGTEAKPAQLPPARPAWVRPTVAQQPGTPVWVYGAVAVALAALATWLLLRRRTTAPPPTPREIFAGDWQAAAASSDGKEAGARLSLALRKYAGAIYRFDGAGSTTRETAIQLRGRMPEVEHRELVRQLDQLDALRWAAEALPVSTLRSSLDTAREWVEAVQRRLDVEAAALREIKGVRAASAMSSQADGGTP